MNVFEKVKAAAGSIGIYACPDVYTEGIKDRWITYNLAYEQGEMYADDTAQDMRSGVQVHLFMPADENFFNLRKQLRNALVSQGFTFPKMVINQIEDNKIRHIVFECEDDLNESEE